VPEAEIRGHTELLASTSDVTPDASGGAALAALVDAVRRGDIEDGARVVLVVTGARPEPSESDESRATTVRPDARDVLDALGLRS
jgi:threonine synthase